MTCPSYIAYITYTAVKVCGCAYRDESVSPQLKSALLGLDDTLKLLAQVLDAVVFRDTWKAIAVAINRELYNGIATEARFSFQVSLLQNAGAQ